MEITASVPKDVGKGTETTVTTDKLLVAGVLSVQSRCPMSTGFLPLWPSAIQPSLLAQPVS